jgi:tRNA (guanine-N7-)-methyltransferase
MRTRKKKWTARELAQNPFILRDASAYAGRFFDIFDAPFQLELGCGKGHFITQTAQNSPNAFFVAIERDPTILAAAARLAEQTLTTRNLIFLELDADKLTEYFKAGDISRLYINFCDPWARKKKWAKRRLTHENFIARYEQLRIPQIHFKTDNRLLFEFSIQSFSARGWRLDKVSLDLHNSPFEGNIMTEYEQKFHTLGMPIYRLEAYNTRRD